MYFPRGHVEQVEAVFQQGLQEQACELQVKIYLEPKEHSKDSRNTLGRDKRTKFYY